MTRFVILPLFMCLGLLFGCEDTHGASFRNPSLDADAGHEDDPIAWEGDWTWEEPLPACGSDAGTETGITCQTGHRIQQPIRISVSADLLTGCANGHIIHLWDGEGEELVSLPDQPLTISIDQAWQGWLAFNVTCGENWNHRIEWSTTTLTNLAQQHLISITSGDIDLTNTVKACPAVTGSNIILPLIPLICGEAPC